MPSRMLAEIAEQPTALAATLAAERGKVSTLGAHLRARGVRLIVLAARGSSDNAAVFGRYLLEIATGIPVSLAAPSVHTLYDARVALDQALVVGVSQSGEGEDICRVLERARAAGAFTLGITNNAGSALVKVADEILLMHGGPELSVAATKTVTQQMLLLHMLASALAGDPAELAVDRIPEHAALALDRRGDVEALVERYRFMENCVVVGRGLQYGNAFELALKLMETCYVVAERFSSADFLHGPLAMIERHFPVFLLAPPGRTLEGSRSLAARLSELRADTLAITADDHVAGLCSRAIRMPSGIDELLAPIPYLIPGQLFAALLAEARGLDPDTPRSLSKVTRTL